MKSGYLKRIVIVFIILAAIFLIIYLPVIFRKNKTNNNPDNPGQAEKAVLLRVETTGGRCPYGGCYSEIFIHQNGSYLRKENNRELSGNFSSAEIKKLKELIKNADFTQIKAKKFTGQCPVEYDGFEIIYNFYEPSERIASCEYEINRKNELFRQIDKIVDEVNARVL